MRALVLVLLLSPALAAAQGRKVLLGGTLRTSPSGSRFALGTGFGTLSVEAKGATVTIGGKTAPLAHLRSEMTVTIFGVLTPAVGAARATLSASRIEAIAPGTPARRRALKKG